MYCLFFPDPMFHPSPSPPPRCCTALLKNKIVHVAHMNASGFRFVVLPNAFVVHR